MTNENAPGLAGHLPGCAGRQDHQHAYDSMSLSKNQLSNERSEIPILMTRRQFAYLVGLYRRLGDRRLKAAMDRLEFKGQVMDLTTAEAGKLIAELRREASQR